MAVAGARVAPPPVRRLFRRTAVPVWALLAALTAVSVAGVAVPRWAQLAPLAVSAVLLGLPHGAVDPYVPVRVGGTRIRRALTVVVRGGLPMAVPLVAFPDQYRAVVAAWVGLFGSTLRAGWAFAPATRLALGAGLGLVTVLTLAWGYRAGGGAVWWTDAAETGLLWAFFLSVPPLLAVGVYFCLWHSLRHVLRVLALDETAVTALGRGEARAALGRFVREAAPLTAPALAAFGGLWLLAPGASTAPGDLLAVYLVLLAVLTLPHTVVVTWLDYRQGVW